MTEGVSPVKREIPIQPGREIDQPERADVDIGPYKQAGTAYRKLFLSSKVD